MLEIKPRALLVKPSTMELQPQPKTNKHYIFHLSACIYINGRKSKLSLSISLSIVTHLNVENIFDTTMQQFKYLSFANYFSIKPEAPCRELHPSHVYQRQREETKQESSCWSSIIIQDRIFGL